MATKRARRSHPSDAGIRAFLIDETFRFVAAIRLLAGIDRIALIGSLTTNKPNPKDADVLVTVADDLDLTMLATESRRLKGRAQTRNCGADIFLANPAGDYLGRICHWRECAPGIRMACDAQHCGRRTYLHDDLDNLRISEELIANPPITVWPRVECDATVPADVLPHLARLQTDMDVHSTR